MPMPMKLVAAVTASVIVLGWFVSIIPARLATRTPPADGLRDL